MFNPGRCFVVRMYLRRIGLQVKEQSNGHPVRQPIPMQNVFVIDHPLVQTKLTELRDFSSDHRKFRALLDEIAMLMVYEVTRDWPTKPKPTRTPLEQMIGQVLSRQVTLVPILRAGLGMA